MCWHNYTQHSGCGHYGEATINPYIPCQTTFKKLSSSRGPSSPPLSPPAEFFPPQMKRSSTTYGKDKSRRFVSMSGFLQRSTSSTGTSRRAVSGPEAIGGVRNSTSSFAGERNDVGVSDHELAYEANLCPALNTRTIVSNEGPQVCKECSKWIEAMRNMLIGYDKGKGVRGTPAFEEFLKNRVEPREVASMLGFLEHPSRMMRRDDNGLYD